MDVNPVSIPDDHTGFASIVRDLVSEPIEGAKRGFLFGSRIIVKFGSHLVEQPLSVFQVKKIHWHYCRTGNVKICSERGPILSLKAKQRPRAPSL